MVCELVGPDSPQYQDIYDYLQSQALPPNLSNNQRKSFIQKPARYAIVSDTLYCRSFDNTLLRCLDTNKACTTLREVHNGICGSHSSGPTLAKKVTRLGYYWLTIEKDAIEYVRTCHKCQIHSDLIHAPAQELWPITSPWPFTQWALNLVGKIHPTSSNGHKFIITATEYFMKWIKAIPLTYITSKQISKFMLNNIICRYGLPQSIITNNGRPFKNQDVCDLCERFHIQHHFLSLYYSQGNSQAEASNKTIVKILKKTVNDTGHGWHIKLNPALWAYCTSIHTPTGATPFALVFGVEAILPIEVEIPSL